MPRICITRETQGLSRRTTAVVRLSDGPDWPPANWPETRDEYMERLRNTPIHLCRLRYRGDEEHWGFAFFAYSSEKYELSVCPFRTILRSTRRRFRSVSECAPALSGRRSNGTSRCQRGHSLLKFHQARLDTGTAGGEHLPCRADAAAWATFVSIKTPPNAGRVTLTAATQSCVGATTST